MTEDSAFFSRNQIVLKDATFGDPVAEKNQATFKQRLMQQFGEDFEDSHADKSVE